jgi:hypothetical protein
LKTTELNNRYEPILLKSNAIKLNPTKFKGIEKNGLIGDKANNNCRIKYNNK